MNKPKRYNKRYLPMLWIGLAIWLLSMLASYIMEKTGHAPAGQETLMDMGKSLFQYMPIGVVLLFCFFQPILEELSFRLWGVGKKWMTIVCLVLMTLFSCSEMGLWGLIFVALFIFVWCAVKDKVLQTWLNAIITSACFALCHISGFDGFSIGMVLGLSDIFGMALVMCWLTINISFLLSCLLHVLNNSIAILFPLFFLSNPVTVTSDSMTATIEPLRPFANNQQLVEDQILLSNLDTLITEFYRVNEPSQMASLLASMADTATDVHYDWVSKGESLEERVVFRVKYNQPQKPDYAELFHTFCDMAKEYNDGKGFTFDTSTTYLKEIWLVYPDGREEKLTPESENAGSAIGRLLDNRFSVRGNELVEEYTLAPDSSMITQYYCFERKSPLAAQLTSMESLYDQLYGFSIDLRPAKEIRVITIK